MKIGFFGAGNMASAIVGGAVSSGNFKAEDISVYDIDNSRQSHRFCGCGGFGCKAEHFSDAPSVNIQKAP